MCAFWYVHVMICEFCMWQVGAHTTGQWRDKWWEDAYAQSVSTITGAEVGLPARGTFFVFQLDRLSSQLLGILTTTLPSLHWVLLL